MTPASGFARSLRSIALAVALGGLLGCGVAGLHPVASNEPVARQALLPEYRVFYDALVDYGDWVLIEPFGFVFRPRVSWNQWMPFQDGFWAPTDAYGWVWISAEPFGWATYHYGEWLYDSYQGWVWIPGVEWMPGSVSWLLAGDYVGWAPLTPPNASSLGDALPPGAVHYAPIGRLGATDLREHLVTREQMGAAAKDSHPIRNVATVGGVAMDRGPSLELVERARGPLARVRVEDLVSIDLGRRMAGAPTRASLPGHATASDSGAAGREAIDRMRRAGEEAASEARRLLDSRTTAPASLPVVRPMLVRPVAAGASRREGRTPADSTR